MSGNIRDNFFRSVGSVDSMGNIRDNFFRSVGSMDRPLR